MKDNKITWIELIENKSYRGMLGDHPLFLLYENKGVWNLDGIFTDKSIHKNSMFDRAQQAVNEYGMGSSFSMGGGGQRIYPGTRFGQVNRGGYNNSMYGGNDNSMYTYSIIPLNSLLQQRSISNENPDEVIIYPGETVKGKELNKKDKKWIVGTLLSIKKSINGTTNYFLVLDNTDKIVKKVDPTSSFVFTKLHNSELRKDIDSFDLDLEKDSTGTELPAVKENIEIYLDKSIDILE